MSPRPRIPNARFVSDRNSADRRYSRPKTAAAVASNKTRNQRTVRVLSPAGCAKRGRCSGPFIRSCYTVARPEALRCPWSGDLVDLGSRVVLRDLAKRIARKLYGGGVHHMPIHAYRA